MHDIYVTIPRWTELKKEIEALFTVGQSNLIRIRIPKAALVTARDVANPL